MMTCQGCASTPACPMCGQPMQQANYLPPTMAPSMASVAKPKRRGIISAYNKRFGRELKAIRKRHLLKSGKWRKGWDGRKAMNQAHKAARRK